MRKGLVLIFLLLLVQIPCFSANKKMIPATSNGEKQLPNIFIYTIPDDIKTPSESEEEKDAEETDYVTDKEICEEEPILLEEDDVMIGATVLKGYAQFVEDSDAIYLKDNNDKFVLNIKTPQKIDGEKGLNLKTIQNRTLQYVDPEYVIAPNSIKSSGSKGNFTFGASYNNEIDNIAMLEAQTGLFTKYEKEKFAISSSLKKSLNTLYSQDYTTISVTPELKVNKYLSLKNVLSADVTRNRRSAEVVLSINPLGNKERFTLEFGAKETFLLDSNSQKTQFKFSTNFKL